MKVKLTDRFKQHGIEMCQKSCPVGANAVASYDVVCGATLHYRFYQNIVNRRVQNNGIVVCQKSCQLVQAL